MKIGDMDCKNLSIEELSKKLKEIESIKDQIKSIYSGLSYYGWFDKYSLYESKEAFAEKPIVSQLSIIEKIICAGRPESLIKTLKKEKEEFKECQEQYREDLSQREMELLNAWNAFKNWKIETSSNLIKMLNKNENL